MTSTVLANLLKMLESGRDSALLRFSLGNEYLKCGEAVRAIEHLRAAVAEQPDYSAAWKLLGRALESNAEFASALAAYNEGAAVAERKGDKQAAREMGVFARRLERKLEDIR